MTVLHSGATKGYSDNFSKAFGKGSGAKKSKGKVTATKAAKKKTAKKRK